MNPFGSQTSLNNIEPDGGFHTGMLLVDVVAHNQTGEAKMHAKDAITVVLKSTGDMLGWFLSDLSDADLLVRPVPSANHIAWQLGHLITSECHLCKQVPVLPTLSCRQVLRSSMTKLQRLRNLPGASGPKPSTLICSTRFGRRPWRVRLDCQMQIWTGQPPATSAQFAPTIGPLLVMAANHTMMHAGQFTVVRRKLGEPILF